MLRPASICPPISEPRALGVLRAITSADANRHARASATHARALTPAHALECANAEQRRRESIQALRVRGRGRVTA
eukprot:3700039-Pleurochrysis_carterae.AAC.1